MVIAVKVITTVVLAFTLFTLGLAMVVMLKEPNNKRQAIAQFVLFIGLLGQVMGIATIWMF